MLWAASSPGAGRAAGRADGAVGRVSEAGVEILQPAYAGGVYEGLLVPVYQGRTMHRFRPGRAGDRDRLDRAAAGVRQQRPARRDAGRRRADGWSTSSGSCRGEQAVVVTSSDEGIDAALDLADGGVNVLAVADSRRDADGGAGRGAGIEYLAGFRPWQARGSKAVTGVVVTRDGEHRTLACDLLVMSGGSVGQHRARHPGRRQHPLRPRPAPLRPRRVPEGMRVVGAAAGSAAAAGAVPARRRRRCASRSSATARTSRPRTSRSRWTRASARWSCPSATRP